MGSPTDGGAAYHEFHVDGETAGQRLDKALASMAEREGLALSRSRLAALVGEGALTIDGKVVETTGRKVRAGQVLGLRLPAPADPIPQAEAIPLNIVYEDDDLLVVNKAAGMVVHPAPGSETGTLVNALLAHCDGKLPGIGGERRPGIVHRIDKDTSGLLVVAKSEPAMTGLSALFAAHDIDRRYQALVWGAPDRADPRLGAVEGVSFTREGEARIETHIARHPNDRKRMAVVPDGRRAVTYLRTLERFGDPKPFAGLIECRLETGRTHQIRVHAAHIGHGLIGDQTYGRPRALPGYLKQNLTKTLHVFARQALHAAVLGFEHPISGDLLQFSAELPEDMHNLLMSLRRNTATQR